MNSVAAVLRLGTYQRFLGAAIFSGVAVWIFQTAIYWAGLQSGDTGTVGILVSAITLPSLLLTLPAGYLTDRAGPFYLLLIGQIAPLFACLGGIAFVSSDGSIALGPAAVVTFAVGIAYALWSVPALVYVTRIVPAPIMGAAISLMVLQYATGRIVGGALGGALVEAGGAGLAFAVSGGMFAFGVLAVLTLPRIGGLDSRTGSTVRGMLEAVRWLRHAPATLALVVLGALSSLLSYAYIPLLGALSRDVIGAGAAGLGILTATSGFGMVASALTAQSVGARIGRGRGVIATSVIGALSMAALGMSTVLAVSIVLVVVTAYLGSTRSSMASFLMQSLAPARMRGRVASLADFIAQIMSLVGSAGVGLAAVTYGPSTVLTAAGGVIVVVVVLVIVVAPKLRSLDVDRDAHPIVGNRPYVEGTVGAHPRVPETG